MKHSFTQNYLRKIRDDLMTVWKQDSGRELSTDTSGQFYSTRYKTRTETQQHKQVYADIDQISL